ncbi:MAG: hypothetical protein H7301_02895 [Cryobacterium sp.]|nr:hypothetical protein [Oligoflexia bacterium]
MNAPAGPCATSTTLSSAISQKANRDILFAHAAAAQNRIGIVKKTGYSVSTDCVNAISTPTVNPFPTAMLLHSSGKLFVAYSNSIVPVHSIYSYDVSATAITNGVHVYNDPSVVAGISALTVMDDGRILVASVHPSMNTVELFNYGTTANSLAPVGTSFILPSTCKKSISSLLIAN